MRPSPRRRGLSLVEVLVALALMAVMALALFGLQAASLRAARTAAQTRLLAAELGYQTGLARVLAGAPTACHVHDAAGSCALSSTCLDVGIGGECLLRSMSVVVTLDSGRSVTALTASYAPLESAAVGVPVPVPAAEAAP